MRWLVFCLLFFWGAASMAEPNQDAVTSVLNRFHKAAAEHDFNSYFSLFSADAVFIGTDATERWDKEAFKAYVKPHFDQGHGWSYKAKERHISFSPDNKVAWFDEILENARLGICRGTGVLVKDGKDWKISQYHLTIPVPNELADKLVQMIKAPKGK